VKAKNLLITIGAGVPVDMDYLLKKVNINLVDANLDPDFKRLKYYTRCVKIPSNNPFSGCGQTIYINNMQSPSSRRFAIAHAVAHFLMNHGDDIIDIPDNYLSCTAKIMEKEANIFAYELLLPENILRMFLINKTSKEEICKYFMVSSVVLDYRIKQIKF
jgi:hypothetical protein